MVLSGICVLLAAVSPINSDPPATKSQDFRLRGEVLEALEGGPLLVRLTLHYNGKKPIEVAPPGHPHFSFGRIQPPKEWAKNERRRMVIYSGGLVSLSKSLSPGDQWTATYYVHHDYQQIPAGRTPLRLEWPIDAPGKWPKDGGRQRIERGAEI